VFEAIRQHWPEYLIEAAGLCIVMISACIFSVILFHPASPLASSIDAPILRRMLMGIAMGSTYIAIIYSPFGKRSGAHINPATTLTFFRLGKVSGHDTTGYVAAHFIGGLTGVLIASLILGALISHPAVNYAATIPGQTGVGVAFVAEVAITFLLMTIILTVSNDMRLARWTGLFVGFLVAIYISFESPISGTSMNPARSFASAVPAQAFRFLWIYFTAPLVGMLLAAELRLRTRGPDSIICAKLHHQNKERCIFNCGYARPMASNESQIENRTNVRREDAVETFGLKTKEMQLDGSMLDNG
jgi:aquaporin Z